MKKPKNLRLRRIFGLLIALAAVGGWLIVNPESYDSEPVSSVTDAAEQGTATSAVPNTDTGANASTQPAASGSALEILDKLEIKGRAPKTGYARTEFYNTWPNVNGCSLRQIIIRREVGNAAVMDGCDVIAGTFTEPYTGETFTATAKSDFSKGIQIDHIVALSDAWQKGAQNLSSDERYNLATDPLNLIAADASANQQKSDGDAATWLPPNKSFRCQYVARQVSVKYKYHLWLTEAEHDAIAGILGTCPSEPAVGI